VFGVDASCSFEGFVVCGLSFEEVGFWFGVECLGMLCVVGG
jgi:hypothetical protein